MPSVEGRYDIDVPSPDTVIWRYMNIASFVSLLQTQELIFRRVDQFRDQQEAAISRPTLEKVIDELYQGAKNTFAKAAPPRLFTEEELRRMAVDFQKLYMAETKKKSFVNCWHENETESVAMWDLYSKQGVAVRSTVEQLAMSQTDATVRICRVQYVNHLSDEVSDLVPFLFKRLEYQHEREIRAFLPREQSIRTDETGQEILFIPVQYDLQNLIDEVRVAPGTPSWLFKAVQQLLISSGLSGTPCNRAEADQLPDFIAELEQRYPPIQQ